MTILVAERPSSPRIGGKDSVERQYVVSGTTNAMAVRPLVLSESPIWDFTSGTPLVRQAPSFEPAPNSLDVWYATVPYGKSEAPELGLVRCNIDAKGETAKLTHSITTVASYAPSGKTAPNFKQAIGVNADGSVEGCDVIMPKFAWTEQWKVPPTLWTPATMRILRGLAGCVNSTYFRGFEPGEVLYLGADGGIEFPPDSQTPMQPAELSMSFASYPNVTGVTIGDITGIAKKGWDYLWVLFSEKEDTSAKMIVRQPRAVYVEQVYQYRSFSTLGIG